jgi:DNA invertase Pin-like site-specific DNA recombinase
MMIQRNRRVAIYTRVSTDGQTCANQELELRAVAERKGCTVVKVYTDRGISGAKGRDKRPAFDALCKDATRREFDVVLAWSVDRLGRSLQDLVGFLSEIHTAGVDLYLHVQGLDTSTPAGKAMFQMLGVFAEFERSLIRERVLAGLARARKHGTKTGNPLGRPKQLDAAAEAAIREARVSGLSFRKTAERFGVSLAAVQRVVNS